MPLETKQKDINGLVVSTVQLSAMRALGLLPRLAKAIAPLFSSAKLAEADEATMALAMVMVLGSFTGKDAQEITRELFTSTRVTVDGKFRDLIGDDAINIAFEGRLPDMLQALAFVLQVNFAGFFPARPKAVESEKAQSESSPPQT